MARLALYILCVAQNYKELPANGAYSAFLPPASVTIRMNRKQEICQVILVVIVVQSALYILCVLPRNIKSCKQTVHILHSDAQLL